MMIKWVQGNFTTVVGAILIAGFFLFPEFTYAQEDSAMKETFETVNLFLGFLSWFWIVPATLAGELLSNDLVFGSKINLERHLRTIWNIMRTFANFTLGVLFLYFLMMQIINAVKGAAISDFITKLGKLFVAAILVNMSFFLIRAVVDISIVAAAAVSSLPYAVIESRRETLKSDIKVKKGYCVFESKLSSQKCDQQENKEIGLDFILPQAGNMGGPIVFMGVGMLDLLAADVVPQDVKNRENLALVTATKLVMIILFTAPILALLVVNMLRVFYIRIWTLFSPFIILDLVLKAGTDDSPMSSVRDKLGYSGLGDILGLIFVPVVVIGTMSLGLIMLMGLMSVVKGGEQYENRSVSNIQVSGSETGSTLAIPKVLDLNIQGSLFQKTAFRTLGVFGEALMVFFTMAILWAMVKVGFASSSIAKEYSGKVFSTVGSFAKAMPIVPLAGGLSVTSIQNAGGIGGITKELSGLKAIEESSKVRADKTANIVRKFFTGETDESLYQFDITTEIAQGIRSVNGIDDNISKLQDAIKDKKSVKYEGNIQSVFEKMQRSDGLDRYFEGNGKSSFEETRGTQGRVNFVGDVLEGRSLQIGRYSSGEAASVQGTSYTPKK